MARRSVRRSGHSRKADFSLFTSYAIAGLGAVIGAALLGLSFWQPSFFSGLRGVASDTGEIGGQATAIGRSQSGGALDYLGGYINAGHQNAELREELELARIRLAELQAVEQENTRLRELLNLNEISGEAVAVTRITGSSAASARRLAYIGAGRNDGVTVGMPVSSDRGIVGRVLETASSTARVLLLTDSESVLPIRRAQDNLIAFAEGRGDGIIRIRLINLGINPIEPGDVFVTSGAGGYYQPGIAVAVATEITDDGALARMIADPAGATYVRVEPIWQPDAVDASLQSPDTVLQDPQEQP